MRQRPVDEQLFRAMSLEISRHLLGMEIEIDDSSGCLAVRVVDRHRTPV